MPCNDAHSPTQVEQGAILEVLNAAARAENRALGKQVAQEVSWKLREERDLN
jgi:hypothetical protein